MGQQQYISVLLQKPLHQTLPLARAGLAGILQSLAMPGVIRCCHRGTTHSLDAEAQEDCSASLKNHAGQGLGGQVSGLTTNA